MLTYRCAVVACVWLAFFNQTGSRGERYVVKIGRLREWVANALDDTPLILSLSLKSHRSGTPGINSCYACTSACTEAVILLR
jgi:hypothetical protein